MRSRALRIPLAVAAFAIISVFGSQAVLADTELGDTGQGRCALADRHARHAGSQVPLQRQWQAQVHRGSSAEHGGRRTGGTTRSSAGA